MKLGKIIAHIPAREGSKRVPNKNIKMLAGKPMIAYAIEAAMNSGVLPEVYVNTDSDSIAEVAKRYGCGVFRRDPELASDTATGDDFTIDFIEKMKPDTLVMVSPVCPLVEASDIAAAIKAYEESDADTLISCTKTQLQTFCEDRPVNIEPVGPLAPSQENPKIYICNWAITVWNADVFRKCYAQFKGGYFGEKRLFWNIDQWKSVKVSEDSDFIFAEKLLKIASLG